MAADEQNPLRVSVPVAWVGLEEMPILFANQFLAQLDDRGDAVVSFGQVMPPVLAGTPEQQIAQAQQVAFVATRPLVRIAMSPERIRELIGVLEQTLAHQGRARQVLESGEEES